jgi:hypothetical protein
LHTVLAGLRAQSDDEHFGIDGSSLEERTSFSHRDFLEIAATHTANDTRGSHEHFGPSVPRRVTAHLRHGHEHARFGSSDGTL